MMGLEKRREVDVQKVSHDPIHRGPDGPREVVLRASVETHEPPQQAPVQHVLLRLVAERRPVVEEPVSPALTRELFRPKKQVVFLVVRSSRGAERSGGKVAFLLFFAGVML